MFAKMQANAAFSDIMKLLEQKYNIHSPETCEKLFGETVHVKEHAQAKLWLKECVEKLFEIEANDSF